MNVHVLILFFNALFITVLSVVIVIRILRKEYLPVIRKLEKEAQEHGTESRNRDKE